MNDSNPRVAYIAGYGRSGSTLLDMILGGHPDCMGAGEVERLFLDIAHGGTCTCGRAYRECPLWGRVLQALPLSDLSAEPAQRALSIKAVETSSGWIVSDRSPRGQRYARVWHAFFHEAARLSGTTTIIDSSKTSRSSALRPLRLARTAGLDVSLIHLVRDPRAVIYSEWKRGNNDRLESARSQGSPVLTLARTTVGWALSNLAASATAPLLHRSGIEVSHLRVRYEDLTSNPDREIARIADFLEIDPAPLHAAVDPGATLEPGHGIRGNRMRRRPASLHAPDDAWTRSDAGALRVLGWLLWPLARSYGYTLTSTGEASWSQ